MRLTIERPVKLSRQIGRHCTKKCTMGFGSPNRHQKLKKNCIVFLNNTYMRAGDPPKNAVFLNNTYARVKLISRPIVNTVLSDIVIYIIYTHDTERIFLLQKSLFFYFINLCIVNSLYCLLLFYSSADHIQNFIILSRICLLSRDCDYSIQNPGDWALLLPKNFTKMSLLPSRPSDWEDANSWHGQNPFINTVYSYARRTEMSLGYIYIP